MHAAIQEQQQEAVDNPIAAASMVSAQNGGPTNDNLLDIDFDGAAPASAEAPPTAGASGLEGLAGTPQRIDSPAAGGASSSMNDMMGLFDMPGPSSGAGAAAAQNDMMNGFEGLDLSGASQPPPAQSQGQGKKTNEDLLGMF